MAVWRRGYRYLHLDAGHACQNLFLGAGSVDCGVCAIAAFSDDDMNDLLELDGVERFVIYVATVGKNKVGFWNNDRIISCPHSIP